MFISKRRARREYVELARSYRERIAEAEKRARIADEQFHRLVRAPLVEKHLDGTVSILIRVEPMLPRESDYSFAERLSRRITEMLYRVHEDWRRDNLTGEVRDLRRDASSQAKPER